MGILEALGRSGALNRNARTVMETAINLRQLRNQEIQQSQENAINLEKMELLRSADKRAAEASEVELRAKTFALEKAKQQDELLDMPVPITQFLGVDYIQDPAKKMIYEKAKEKGWVTEAAPGVEMTTRRYGKAFMEYMGEDLEFSKKLNETNMVKISKQIMEIGTALMEETNPKKVEELTQSKKKLEQQLGMLTKAAKEIDIEHQKKLELEAAKDTGMTDYQRESLELRREANEQRARTAQEREAEKGKSKEGEVYRQLKEMVGLSDFIEKAQDPQLRKTYEDAAALAGDILNNPTGYGLRKDAKAGAIAQRALEIIRTRKGGASEPALKTEGTKRPPLNSFAR